MEREINQCLRKEISDLQEKSSFDDRRIRQLFEQNGKLVEANERLSKDNERLSKDNERLSKDNEQLHNAMEEIRKQLNCLKNTVTIQSLGKRSFAGRSLYTLLIFSMNTL